MENGNQINEIKNKKTGNKDVLKTVLSLPKRFYNCIMPDNIRTNDTATKKLLRLIIVLIVFFVAQAALITAVIFTTVKISGESVRLPSVVGLDMYEAMEMLQAEGFNLNIEVQYFNDRPTKTIVVQKPDADTILRTGRTVNLIVNDTVTVGDMPSVIGLSYEEALNKITESLTTSKKVNLKTLEPLYVSDSKAQAGVILAQSPIENEKLTTSSAIQLTINSYKPRASGGGSSGNTAFNYAVPMSVSENSVLSISLDDDSGTRTIYEKTVKAAERISFRYNLTGSGTITIYYDEVPFETMQVSQ